jgi:transposase
VRPVALGHHRFEWLRVTAFVQPATGEAVRFLSTGLGKPLFEAPLAAFARQAGAGRGRHVVLVLDNAGWHGPKGSAVPDGITPVFLPPYSPELQPAERLWPLVDEPVANKRFATLDDLDAVVAERCRRLDPAAIKPHTAFHWWPKPNRRADHPDAVSAVRARARSGRIVPRIGAAFASRRRSISGTSTAKSSSSKIAAASRGRSSL